MGVKWIMEDHYTFTDSQTICVCACVFSQAYTLETDFLKCSLYKSFYFNFSVCLKI